MADDNVDISGMPDPGTIGLDPAKQVDPSAGMPDPEDLYRQYHYSPVPNANGKRGPMEPIPQDLLDEFMANPPTNETAGKNFRHGASALTGLPRAAAGVASAVPAGVASVAGQATGALGAVLDPENAASYLDQGRERGRAWSSKIANLANYVPATERGAELSNSLLELPGQVGHSINENMVAPVVGDNASQMIGDIAQDVATDLPALGAPAAVRGVAKGVKTAARTAKGVYDSEAASVNPTPAAPPAIKPDFKESVSPESLRAAPNPIPPPEGTVAAAKAKVKMDPRRAIVAIPEQPAAAAEPVLPETDNAPLNMNLSPEQRALVREGVAARRSSQRGSVRLFNSPAEEGPKETPAPEQQDERVGHLDAIDKLSGGLLPTRRTSALTGDYNATGDDFQMKEVGNEQMRKQLASENDAMHAATENVHNSVGSDFGNSVDSTTLGDRGRVTRNAVQAIEKHFDDATDGIYDAAREQNQGRPIESLKRVKAYLDDDSNFTNDAEIGLQRAAKQRLERLWSTGDPDKGAPPGSVNAAERLREFLNEKGKNPQAMSVAGDLKGHLDMDVAEHGGPGLFQAARAMRRHKYQMLEEPTGIKKLLTPGDSQGINHAIPEHKVMDYIADLPREQHEHVMNVLRAGAHLDPEIAKSSAAAIREIQAHAISRIHDASRNADGSWNARKFYNAADRYARNAPETFKDRPDILAHLKTINDAGNTLHMDKHYPGAAAQTERTGAVGHIVEAGGNIASGLAHDIPLIGRMVGRAMERGVEGLGGKISESTRDKQVAKRLVDRTGKQRGSVQVMPSHEEFEKNGEHVTLATPIKHTTDMHGDHVFSTGEGKSRLTAENTEDGGLRVVLSYTKPGERGSGHGGVLYKHAADTALKNGGSFTSDSNVSVDAARRWQELRNQGYNLERSPSAKPTADKGLITTDDSPVFSIKSKRSAVPAAQRGSFSFQNDNALNNATAASRSGQRGGVERNPRSEYNANRQIAGNAKETSERSEILRRLSGQRGSVKVMNDEEGSGSQLNVGLHQGTEGDKGFRKMSKQEAQSAIESTGAKVTKTSVLTPKQHGVMEPTAVMSTDRPLSHEEMRSVLAQTKQSAIPQRADNGDESMHVAPGHEQTAKEQGWDSFNPDYFREHSGQTATDAMANPKNIHPGSTVRDPKRSAYPGIYEDPKDIVSKVKAVPESPHLKAIFGTTRQQMHDDVIKQGDVAPKTPMPGMATKGNGSAHAAQVTTPENADRIRSTIAAFKEHHPNAYNGMVSWYHMDPMYQSIKKILGGNADRAGDVYHKLNTYTALASPMSSVEPEIRRGTAAATMAAEGKFEKFATHGGQPGSKTALKKAPELMTPEMGNEGHAFHGTAHTPAMSRFNETGQEANAPKTGAYRRASDAPSRPGSEYQNTVLVGDSHFSRGAGLADVRGAAAYDGSIEGPELKAVHPWYHENVAKPLGLPATSAQAAQWAALSHETGVETAIGAPKLEIWADQIAIAADKAGVTPKEMWQRIVKRLAAK